MVSKGLTPPSFSDAQSRIVDAPRGAGPESIPRDGCGLANWSTAFFETTVACGYGFLRCAIAHHSSCFARPGMTCVRDLAARFARGFANSFAPLRKEGAGNAGCTLHPRSRVQMRIKNTHTSIQGSGGSPTSPAQWLYGLLRALPGERALLPPSSLRIASQELSASVAAPGPHDFAVRDQRFRPGAKMPDAAASTASHPNVQ
jgi:hypothetical protein